MDLPLFFKTEGAKHPQSCAHDGGTWQHRKLTMLREFDLVLDENANSRKTNIMQKI